MENNRGDLIQDKILSELDYIESYMANIAGIRLIDTDQVVLCGMDKKSNTIRHLLYEGIKKIIRKIF